MAQVLIGDHPSSDNPPVTATIGVKVMHLNVGGGQLGYLSHVKSFWALKGAMDLS